jgi:ribosomal-protein-alanine N-acetyltransferase
MASCSWQRRPEYRGIGLRPVGGNTMISEHEIGLARARDAARIAEMSRDFIEYGLGWKWTAARVLRCLQDSSTNVAAARERNALMGFAIMHYQEHEAHLLLFAVGAAHRRRGVGSALLSWLEATALTAGIGVIYLEARARNAQARAFYRKHGYSEIARVRGMYRGVEDGVRIAKDLWAEP